MTKPVSRATSACGVSPIRRTRPRWFLGNIRPTQERARARGSRSLVLLCGLIVVSCFAVPGGGQPPGGVDNRRGVPSPAAQAERPRLLARPFEQPQQLLQLLDIGRSDLGALVDGEMITAVDEEPLMKILFRMPQIEPTDIQRWLKPLPAADELAVQSASLRGNFYLVEGRVRRISRQSMRPRLAGLFEFDHYYEVHLDLEPVAAEQRPFSALIFVRAVPDAWQDQPELNERCRVTGMFLKRGPDLDNRRQFLFAAPQVAWLPDRVNPRLGIGPSDVLLAQLDMDIALLGTVRTRNGLPIGASERDCFYALLEAAAGAQQDRLDQQAEPMSLAAVLQQPAQWHGRLLTTRGTVRRITQVMVSEPDIQQRFGIDRYYQFDVLVDVGDRPVEVRGEAATGQGLVYGNTFPVTCCSLALPEVWQPLVGQPKVNQEARLTGFFFKLWAYPNAYVTAIDQRQRQLSPMLILRTPVALSGPVRQTQVSGILIGTGFLIILGLVWGLIWWTHRIDQRHRTELLQERFRSRTSSDIQVANPPES